MRGGLLPRRPCPMSPRHPPGLPTLVLPPNPHPRVPVTPPITQPRAPPASFVVNNDPEGRGRRGLPPQLDTRVCLLYERGFRSCDLWSFLSTRCDFPVAARVAVTRLPTPSDTEVRGIERPRLKAGEIAKLSRKKMVRLAPGGPAHLTTGN